MITLLLSALVSTTQPNVVLIVMDDVGTEAVSCYEGPPGLTPTFDSLADQGLRFTNFWGYPSCSPFRSALLTGSHAHETGVTWVIALDEYGGPTSTTPTIADIPNYSSALVGKWHTSRHLPSHNFLGPVLYGFDVFAGTEANLPPEDYFGWTNRTAWEWGTGQEWSTTHTTEVITDNAITMVNAFEEPYLLWVNYHAAHKPFQPPTGTTGDDLADYLSLIQDMDFHISRLLNVLDLADTFVVIMGDNGTPKNVTQHTDQSKFTLFEPGIRLPCTVAGPGVRQGVSDALVSVVDWLPTVWELAGNDPGPLGGSFHGQSFKAVLESDVPHNQYLFSELARPYRGNHNGVFNRIERAIRDERWKLIRYVDDNVDVLYDLDTDPGEDNPVCMSPCGLGEATPAQMLAFERLKDELDAVPMAEVE